MKKVLLAGSALIAALSFVSAAHAADMPAAPSYNWTGFYVGANAGVSWNNSSVDNKFSVDGTRLNDIDNKIDNSQAAFTAGGLLGYNYQIDHIVLGVETDFNYLGFDENGSRKYSFDHGGDVGEVDLSAKGDLQTDWFGTIRGRLGYAADNFLVYGTGGLAYGNVNSNGKVTLSNDGTDYTWKGSNDQTNWGWTVGGGVEYGIDQWSLGVEYLYVNLGSGNWSDNHEEDLPHDFGLKGSADYAFSTVRATVKYRFQ